ncbi:MAG TPA: zinc-ribbon domain-containing protein [Pyrinomonadaceae bacterium]|nr:zinc-ribbon domain-containing protein [Pyrinomonadaceae bacterium]
MALVYCPECGHEISNAAVACPHCGRPIAKNSLIEHRVAKPSATREEGVPKWAIIPIVAIGTAILIAFLFLFARNGEDANSNLRVAVNTQKPSTTPINVPSSETTIGTATEDGTISVPSDSQISTVPGSQVAVPSKGTVVIDAKMTAKNGSAQPVRKEKFYLLDKDLETILSDGGIEPIVGQSLLNSFGLSVVYPDRYGDFNRRALAAIKPHIKYAGTTDVNGKASLGGIEPSSYYLFGITKSGNSFAMWSSPVAVIAGENTLNLSPAPLTEIDLSSGE